MVMRDYSATFPLPLKSMLHKQKYDEENYEGSLTKLICVTFGIVCNKLNDMFWDFS